MVFLSETQISKVINPQMAHSKISTRKGHKNRIMSGISFESAKLETKGQKTSPFSLLFPQVFDLEVSKNSGTPKWMVDNGKP